ncbi:hypothetical protein I4U23_015966 [Adineta vaga]|nr:hypothetical protein I4U23_015966 [Adineta vaga]
MKSILIFLIFINLIANINSYGCDCSCCSGSGCSLVYLGTIKVPTCASTTCTDACKASYTTCLIGSSSAVCSGRIIFQFYTNLFLITSTFFFIMMFNRSKH